GLAADERVRQRVAPVPAAVADPPLRRAVAVRRGEGPGRGRRPDRVGGRVGQGEGAALHRAVRVRRGRRRDRRGAGCRGGGGVMTLIGTEVDEQAETPVVSFDAALPDAVNTLTQAIGDVDALSFTYLAEHPDDEVALLAFLACVRAQRMRLAQVEAVLEASAVKVM